MCRTAATGSKITTTKTPTPAPGAAVYQCRCAAAGQRKPKLQGAPDRSEPADKLAEGEKEPKKKEVLLPPAAPNRRGVVRPGGATPPESWARPAPEAPGTPEA